MTEHLKIDPLEEIIKAIRIIHGESADAIIFKALIDAQVDLVKMVKTINIPMAVAPPVVAAPSDRPAQHELKSWPKFFQAIFNGDKTFEVRVNDRNFREQDSILLREYNPETGMYSGRELFLKITYLMHLTDWLRSQNIGWQFSVPDNGSFDIVVMSFKIEKWRRPDDSTN